MDPVLRVSLGLALFAATHLGLAWPPIRQPLVARLGPFGFTAFYSVVAWITFGIAVSGYAAHAAEGPPGLGLGAYPAVRAVAIAVIALGVMLMAGAFADYGSSPFAIGSRRVREPVGLERVTRHPFFVGAALLGLAHALIAPRLVGAILTGGLGALSLLGSHLQDRKHAALRGADFERYLAQSSLLPFVAIAAGRQRFVASELPYGRLAAGLAIAFALRAVHEHLFAHGGVYVIAALVIGPLGILFADWRRDRARRRVAAGAVVSAWIA